MSDQPPSELPQLVTRQLLPANAGYFIIGLRAAINADTKVVLEEKHKIPVVAWSIQSGPGNMVNPVPLWPIIVPPADPQGWIHYVGVLLPDGRIIGDNGQIFGSQSAFGKACREARLNVHLQVAMPAGGKQ